MFIILFVIFYQKVTCSVDTGLVHGSAQPTSLGQELHNQGRGELGRVVGRSQESNLPQIESISKLYMYPAIASKFIPGWGEDLPHIQ